MFFLPALAVVWLNAQRGKAGHKSPELVAAFARCHAGRRLRAARPRYCTNTAVLGTKRRGTWNQASARVAEAWASFEHEWGRLRR